MLYKHHLSSSLPPPPFTAPPLIYLKQLKLPSQIYNFVHHFITVTIILTAGHFYYDSSCCYIYFALFVLATAPLPTPRMSVLVRGIPPLLLSPLLLFLMLYPCFALLCLLTRSVSLGFAALRCFFNIVTRCAGGMRGRGRGGDCSENCRDCGHKVSLGLHK